MRERSREKKSGRVIEGVKRRIVWKKRPQAIFIQIPEPPVIIAKLRSSITHGTRSIPLPPLNSIPLSDVILSLTPFARTACTRADKTEEWSVRMRERKSGCMRWESVEALFSALSRLTNEIHALTPQVASHAHPSTSRLEYSRDTSWVMREFSSRAISRWINYGRCVRHCCDQGNFSAFCRLMSLAREREGRVRITSYFMQDNLCVIFMGYFLINFTYFSSSIRLARTGFSTRVLHILDPLFDGLLFYGSPMASMFHELNKFIHVYLN